MKLFRIIPCALMLLALCSCGSKPILEQTITFDNDTWMRFQPEKFDCEVKNIDDCYNFDMTAVIDTAKYHQSGLPCMLTISSPNGETRTSFFTLVLRNKSNNFMGEFDDEGHLVIHDHVREYYFFNAEGVYNFELSQRTDRYEIHGIKEVKFSITKAKLDLPSD